MTSSAENILYADYIRYDKLYELTKYAFYGSPDPGNEIDIFIDMNSMLRSLYIWSENVLFDKDNVITSSMLNLAAHLKHYFLTRHQVYARIYIVYGDNFPKLPREVNPSYNQTAYSRYATEINVTDKIREAINVLSILVPYIQDVYFVYDTEVETGVLISAIMKYNSLLNSIAYNKKPKIVYSKDTYCYQLVAMEPYTFLYRPKKSPNQEDTSWVVPKSQLYESYAFETGLVVQPGTPIVDVESLSLIMAMSGLRSRNIRGPFKFSNAMKIVHRAHQDLMIVHGYNVAFEMGLDQYISDKAKIAQITQNFKAIDLVQNTQLYITEKSAMSIQRFMLDLHDPQAVKEINDKYFRNNPIDIMAL